ncbi:hypothetical protein QEN19_003405 [Hanseniaspora menglaensis]
MFAKNAVLFAQKGFKLKPEYQLKCGLEIHTQLSTMKKLFSHSKNDPFMAISTPNSNISMFDVSMPGTQPIFNYETLLFGLKLAAYLKCKDINFSSKFDRKHYFYQDNPQGYQLTQKFDPLAQNGSLKLISAIDGVFKDKNIRISTIQLEQDTGKSLVRLGESNDQTKGLIEIDLNRNNVPLIELVTEPDFESVDEVKAFLQKYQKIVRFLGICRGDMEQGTLRCDVNVNVNDHCLVELKNLPTTSSITHAIQYEYMRQIDNLENGYKGIKETRNWDGEKTVSIREKNVAVDYRFMPDNELKPLKISQKLVEQVEKSIPFDLDSEVLKLINEPFKLSLLNSNKLLDKDENDGIFILDYYKTMANKYLYSYHQGNSNIQLLNNIFFNDILVNIAKIPNLSFKEFTELFSHESVLDLVNLINTGNFITRPNAELLLNFALSSKLKNPDWVLFVEENGLSKISLQSLTQEQQDEIYRKITESFDPTILSAIYKKPHAEKKKKDEQKFEKGLNVAIKTALELTNNRIDPLDLRKIIINHL